MRSNVYMMVGIPGSGKSTWVKNNHPDLPVVSRDIIRSELGYTSGPDEKVVLSRQQENIVTTIEYGMMDELLESGNDFVIDDVNTGKHRKKLIGYLKNKGAYIIGVVMNTQLDTCIERRKGQIPASNMRGIYARLIPLEADEVDEVVNVCF